MKKNIFYAICVLLVTLGINGCISYNDMQLKLANGQNDIPSDAIGSFSFSNPRYNNAFQLVRGEGDTDNGLFEIRRGRELILKNGVTPTTKQYSVRVAMGASSTAGGMQKIFTFTLPVKEAPEIMLVQQQVSEPPRPAAPYTQLTVGIEDDFEVIQNVDGNTLAIISYKGSTTDLIIPRELYGLPVTTIGEGAFLRKGLTSVVIPDSITTIKSATTRNGMYSYGNGAFQGNQLTSIIIPDSVTYIGDFAFIDNLLISVTIGNGVTYIGDCAFSAILINGLLTRTGNRITDVRIGNSVTHIGYNAFNNNLLTSVTIPNSVISIGDGAFDDNQLTSVIIGNNVTSLGSSFSRNKLTDVIIPNRVTAIESLAFSDNQLVNVTIGTSVTSIGDRAFENNKLTSVVIPDSVVTIGSNAFRGNQLTSISLGRGINIIWGGAFSGSQLTSITIAKDVQGGRVQRDILIYNHYGISLETGFEQGFLNYYTGQNRSPGTYIKNGPIWSKR